MRLVASKIDLARALAFVGEAINRKAPHPSAHLLLLTVSTKDSAEMSAFDGFSSASVGFQVSSGAKGAIALSAGDLADRVRAMPDDSQVTITITGERAAVTSGKRVHTLAVVAPSDVVAPPKIDDDGRPMTIPSDMLGRLLSAVSYAQHENPQGQFPGTQFTLAPPVIRADAGTGRGLASHAETHDGVDVAGQFMLGPRSAASIRRMLDASEAVTLRIAPSRAIVNVARMSLTCPFLDSRPIPTLEQLGVPPVSEKRVILTRADLADALRGISPASTDEYRSVLLQGGGKVLKLEASGTSGDGTDEVPVTHADKFSVRVPLAQLTAAVTALDCTVVELGICDETRHPLVVQPPEQPSGGMMRHLIMPIYKP